MPSLASGDVLSIIESAYALEPAPDAWLRDLAERVYAHLGADIGASAFFYHVDAAARITVSEPLLLDVAQAPPIRQSMEMLPADFVRKSFARCECTTQSAALDDVMRAQLAPVLEAMAQFFGWRDVAMVGGMDPTGHGVYIGAWLPTETTLAPPDREMWTRIAVHVAAANRLRRRLRTETLTTPEAVLSPDGRVEHAQAEATTRAARTALEEAVRRIEAARGRLRREHPHEAVAAWRGLVSRRWSLVDDFESDGKRFVVAHRNEALRGGIGALTDRERQAVAYAAMGQTNKLIAYEMGISASTVGVLLHRAAKKVGASSREALITAYLASIPPEDPSGGR